MDGPSRLYCPRGFISLTREWKSIRENTDILMVDRLMTDVIYKTSFPMMQVECE
jgi:hypothetical protein